MHTTIWRRAGGTDAWTRLPALALVAITLCAGCDQTGGHNKDGSPIVQPDSEQGVKALAESEKLLKLRQEQEAKSHRRPRVSPEPE